MSTITLEINIKNTSIKSIINNKIELLDLIHQEQFEKLKEFLFDNLTDKDGAPQISDFKISLFETNSDHTKGRFRLKFNINRQFCCSDTEACQSDYLDFNFVVADGILLANGTFMNWNLDN